jgi:hypothetical protein
MIKSGPARYRSKTTGQFVSEDFAREHPDDAYAVGGRAPLLLLGLAAGLLGLAVAAGLVYRSRR